MKNKIIIVLLALVILVGAFIIYKNGFNLVFEYSGFNRMNIKFSEYFILDDVDKMAKEVLGDAEYRIDYIDEFEAGVVIKVKEISEEQVKTLESKLKEKYPSFVHEEEDTTHVIIQELETPAVNSYDLIREYIMAVVITAVIAIIFLAIMFYKLGLLKSFGISSMVVIGVLALYVSAIAILRIPLNRYVISAGLLVYSLSIMGVAVYLKTKKD